MACSHTGIQQDTIHTARSANENVFAPWTAARCRRLLRPLSANIVLLRKEKQRSANVAGNQPSHGSTVDSVDSKTRNNLKEQRGRRWTSEAVDITDQEWAPNPRPRKRIKRTYSSKNLACQRPDDSSRFGLAEQRSRIPSEIAVPNNFLMPERQCNDNDAASSQVNSASQEEGSYPTAPSAENPVGPDPSLWSDSSKSRYRVKLSFEAKLTDGILKGLEATLKVTQNVKPSRGTRSLFATCLRTVPDHIAYEEEQCAVEDSESDIDISSFLYGDLESLGTSNSGGWPPLQQVVRAHSVRLVGGALREGIIAIGSAHRIVALCVRLNAYDEAQHLLHCVLESVEPWQKPFKGSEQLSEALLLLDNYVQRTDRRDFHYRELAWLLRSGRLPLDWIGKHSMVEIWNRVVQAVTGDEHHNRAGIELLRVATTMSWGLCRHDPATFVHAVRLSRLKYVKQANGCLVDLGYETKWPRGSKVEAINQGQSPDGKVSSTVSSITTVLCTIGLLRSSKNITNSNTHVAPALFGMQVIAMDAQQLLELISTRLCVLPDEGMMVAILGGCLIHATMYHDWRDSAHRVPNLSDLLPMLDEDEHAVDEASSFLCAVAECSARAASASVFDYTQQVVQQILHMAKSLGRGSAGYDFCNRIAVATALEYANATKHAKHLHWALDVERTVLGAHAESGQRTPAKTPIRRQGRSGHGYRWEAGICEWVARTPAIVQVGLSSEAQRTMDPQKTEDESAGAHEAKAVGDDASAAHSPSHGESVVAKPRTHAKPRAVERCDLTGAQVADECSTQRALFSHVCIIPRSGDEQSASAVSRGPQTRKRSQLEEIQNNNNVNRGTKRRMATAQQSFKRCRRHGGQSWCSELGARQCQILDMDKQDKQDTGWDSEDELSLM
ncbi:MAG: hypothetical protein Q9183_002161 [Haloplaca sp. 2 TL-2023]